MGDYQHELGFIDRRFLGQLGGSDADAGAPAGAVVYWQVDDLPATLEHVLARGAQVHEPVREFGHGFVAAAVVDPFGNILGLMTNPHYREILATMRTPNPLSNS